MKRIAAFFFAFFAVCYLQIADADAQFRRECRYGFCVPSGGPTGTPVSNACVSTPGTTITFTAQGTGTANANRISVVSINWSSAGSSELTAVSIGGISMARAVRASASTIGNNSEIWYVANPTGTSSNIVLTASVALTGATIEVYSLIGYKSVVATTVGTTSVSQTYSNKQLAIAAGSRATNVSTSLSNMVNDFSSACGLGLWGVHASQSLKGSSTLTSAISPTTSSPEIAMVVWQTIAQPACTSLMTGLIANWDLNNFSSLSIASGVVTAVADTNGSNNVLGNGLTPNKPTYNSSGLGGHPTMTFTATGQAMGTQVAFPIGTGNTLTYYVVGTISSTSQANARIMTYYDGVGSDFNSIGSFTQGRSGTTSTTAITRNSTNTSPLGSFSYDTPLVFMGVFNGSGITLYLNGSSLSTGSVNGNWVSGGAFGVYFSPSDLSYVLGNVSEAAVATGALSSGDALTTYNCLKAKWGL